MKAKTRKQRIHPDTVVLIKQIVLGVLIFSAIGLFVAAIWYGTRVSALNIQTVEVSGGETVSHQLIKEKVQAELSGTYIGLVPHSFVYMYPKEDIQGALAGIERVKNITIERTDNKTLMISFTEYISDALWCKAELTDCVFIDDTGFAFSPAPTLQGGAFLRFVLSGEEPALGQSITSTSNYHNLKEITARLRERDWNVSRMDIDVAEDVYLALLDGGEIKFNLAQTPDEVLSNLDSVLSSEEFVDVTPGTFKYIDLRFGNKVFVNRSFEEIATSTEAVPEDVLVTDTPNGEIATARVMADAEENEVEAVTVTEAATTSASSTVESD